MNLFSDPSVFAVVLAVNLVLIGAVLAGGIALIFRFSENVAPRLRYYAAVGVFLTAILFPLAATTARQNFAGEEKTSRITSETARKNNSPMAVQNDFSGRQSVELELPTADSDSSVNFLSGFIERVSDSFFGNVFLIVWITGIVLLFSREAIGLWRLRKTRKPWILATEREREILQCAGKVPLFFAADQTPGTAGLFRPAIVLPREFPAGISLESKRFIVRHELAHAWHFDPLGSFLLRSVRNLFWVSPALWLIESLLGAEREAAADRAAIDGLSKAEYYETTALNYAETLLLIAKAFKITERLNAGRQLIGIGSGGELEIRVRRLLSSRRSNRRQVVSALSACLLTVALIAAIPRTAVSEISRKNYSDFVLAENDREVSADDKINAFSLPPNENDFRLLLEIAEAGEEQNQSGIHLKKSANENSIPSEPNLKQSARRIENQNFKTAAGNEKAKFSAEISDGRDAGETEAKENQQNRERLNSLKPLPASSGLSNELETLSNMRPASRLKIVALNEGETARQKAASEYNNRRNYPATAELPKLKPYETKYIPYPAKRND